MILGIKPKVQLMTGRQSTIKLHSPEHKGAVFKADSTILLIEACFGKIKKQVCGAQIFFGENGLKMDQSLTVKQGTVNFSSLDMTHQKN